MKEYFTNVAVHISQTVNVIIGGKADEMLSARAWRLRKHFPWNYIRIILDWIFFWQDNHCEETYYWEKNLTDFPGEYKRLK